MFEFIKDRKTFIWIGFTIIFIILSFRLAQLTIVEGEDLYKKSLQSRIKKVSIPAKRGEIYDINGKTLALNEINYSLEFLNTKRFSKNEEEMFISLFSFLKENDEQIIELPIKYENNEFYYQADVDIKNWLEKNGFETNIEAADVLKKLRENADIPEESSNSSAMKILSLLGNAPPINLKTLNYTYVDNLNNFLKGYNIDISNKISAKEAFDEVKAYYNISDEYNDQESYYIASIRHAIREKGYLRYVPIKIARNVKKESIILVKEKSSYYKNIDVTFEPYRVYPYPNSVSHILGYMGFISSEDEIKKYNSQNGYNIYDMIGKIGIEGKYENILRGQNGYEHIYVDAYGGFVKKINNEIPDNTEYIDLPAKTGSNIKLTIDIDFQEYVRNQLIEFLKALSETGEYKSKYGDFKFNELQKNAKSGAIVVTEVKTGKILALVSYPDYDINLFSNGISQKDWDSLKPDNERNPLAPSPMYNMTTLTAIQPGSTFKMITAFAALEAGLNPYAKYRDAGYIQTTDGRRFGCWIWNQFGGNHGLVDLPRALAVSCNYYFYNLAKGYDHSAKRNMNFTMDTDKILVAAEKFGLGENTGIEIGDRAVPLPSPENKTEVTLHYLGVELEEILKDFIEPEIYNDFIARKTLIENIKDIGRENSLISRDNLIENIRELTNIKDDKKLENLVDIVKYSYFNQINWSDGDAFNLSIGQGSNQYTPVQMARYISTIANGGYLNKLSIVDSIGDKKLIGSEPVFIDKNDKIKYIQEGMEAVTKETDGSGYKYFKNFPLDVSAKTGTAEKAGKLPPKDEEEYLIRNLYKISPNINKNDLVVETAIILKNRTQRIAMLYDRVKNASKSEDVSSIQTLLDSLSKSDYLTRGSAMREAIKTLSSNRNLTDEMIDAYKQDFDNFTWFVSYAPSNNPEIAITVMIPQGGSGSYGALISREIYGKYFGL